MDLKKIKGKYYFERLATDYDNLKKSKNEDQDENLMNLLYSYEDACFALGRSDADELMQAIILYYDSKPVEQ